MGKFKLSITMGEDSMQEPGDLAAALRELATKIEALAPRETSARGGILDDNGTSCGSWTFENTSEEEEDDD